MIIGQSHSLEDEDIFNESVKGMSQFFNKKTHTHVDMFVDGMHGKKFNHQKGDLVS